MEFSDNWMKAQGAHIRVFGSFELSFENRIIHLPAKADELMAYLAVYGGQPIARTRLAGVLWPDLSDSRAMANLSTTLWRLRSADIAVRDLPLLIERDVIGLHKAQVSADLWEFEEIVDRLLRDHVADLELLKTLLQIHRGEFLENGPEQDWIIAERERTRLLLVRSLEKSLNALGAIRFHPDSVALQEVLLRLDPLNEKACREVMRACLVQGNYRDGLRFYQQLVKRLREDLDLAPELETRELYYLLLGRRRRSEASLGERSNLEEGSTHRIVGRQRELEVLEKLLERRSLGGFLLAGIQGEVGIGKTRLLEELVIRERAKGAVVVASRCNDVPRPRPYEPIFELFEALSLDMKLLPQLGIDRSFLRASVETEGQDSKDGHPRDRIRFFERIAENLKQLSDAVPCVLVIEDIHNSDFATLELIEYLRRTLESSRVGLVLSWRLEDCDSKLHRWLSSRKNVDYVVEVPPLNHREIMELCNIILPAESQSERILDLIWTQSDGNPLIALEIARNVEPRSTFRTSNLSQAVLAEEENLYRLQGIIRRRVNRLPKMTRSVLRYACAAGRTLELDTLARAIGCTEDGLLNAIDKLVEVGLVRERQDRLEFHHERIREICYGFLTPSDRVKIHRKLGTVLAQNCSWRLADLAYHLEQSGDFQAAGGCWERLGDEANRLWAPLDAANAYTKALNCLSKVIAADRAHHSLLRKRALSWLYLGEADKGESDSLRMVHLAEANGDVQSCAEALILLGRFHLAKERLREALRVSENALELARSLPDRGLETSARELKAFILYRMAHHSSARAQFEELIPVLEMENDRAALERTWNALARIALAEGRNRDAVDAWDRADRYWDGNIYERAVRAAGKGLTLFLMGRAREAAARFQLSKSDFSRIGNPAGQALINTFLATLSWARGDIHSALTLARSAKSFKCDENLRWKLIILTNLVSDLLIPLGSYSLARRLLKKAERLAPHPESEGNILELGAELALEEGDLDDALLLATRAVEQHLPSPGYCQYSLFALGRVYFQLGQLAQAAEVLERSARIFEAGSERLPLPEVFSYLALAFKGLRREQEARRYLESAHQTLHANGNISPRPQLVYWASFSVLRDIDSAAAQKWLGRAQAAIMRIARQLGQVGRRRYLSTRLNRVIEAEWRALFGSGKDLTSKPKFEEADKDYRRFLVPIIGAPRGRHLTPADMIEVIWTIADRRNEAHLKDSQGQIAVRRSRILRLCAEAQVQGAEPRESDLARALGVSIRTVRADVAYLRSHGCIVHTRGESFRSRRGFAASAY